MAHRLAQGLLNYKTMGKKFLYICFFLSALIVWQAAFSPTPARAWDGMSEMEEALFDRINTARAAYGNGSWDSGLDALVPDGRLFESAQAHAADLVENEYYSKESLDGLTPADRMTEASYLALKSGEVLGKVMFQRYLKKADAVTALYTNMLQNENSDEADPVIFSEDLKELGLSIQSGTCYVSGVKFNYYLVVADFGTEKVTTGEKAILLGVNLERKEDLLSSLAFDPDLYLAAREKLDLLISSYAEQGTGDESICSEDTCISKVWITTDEKNEDTVSDVILGKVLSNDAREIVLGSNVDCAGAAMAVSVPMLFDEESTYYVHALVIMLDQKDSEGGKYELSGIIFENQEGDGLCDEGDPLSSEFIYISGTNGTIAAYSGDLGEFAVKLLPGEYTAAYLGQYIDVILEQGHKITLLSVDATQDIN